MRILLSCLWANVDVQLKVLNHIEEIAYGGIILFALCDSNCKELLGVASIFEALEDRSGELISLS